MLRASEQWNFSVRDNSLLVWLSFILALPFRTCREFFKSALRWRRNSKSEAIMFFTTALVHLDVFTFCAVKCSYALCLLPTPPSSPPGCIIIYCFHCSEGRKREKIVLVVLFTTHSDIQFSRQTGHTFICVVMANPCPPTAKKQVNKKRNSFSLPSTLHSPSPFSFDLSGSFNC